MEIVKDLKTRNLTPYFDHIGKDPYLKTSIRYRAVSRFKIDNGSFVQLENLPLFQSQEYNKLEGFGGIKRHYVDVPPGITKDEVFLKAAKLFVEYAKCENFSAHMIRTVAPGAPVPEGRHSDGTDFQGLLVVTRNNLSGSSAKTTIWDKEDEIIFNEEIINEGTIVLFNDADCLHYTSDIFPGEEEDQSFRDVIVFSTPEHGSYVKDNA